MNRTISASINTAIVIALCRMAANGDEGATYLLGGLAVLHIALIWAQASLIDAKNELIDLLERRAE